MRLVDSRRLFGRNLMLDGPGVIAEVEFDAGEDFERTVDAWAARIDAWVPGRPAAARRFTGGAAMCVGGFHDELLALCDVNEAAVTGADPPLAALAAAVDPALRALARAAEGRDVPLLVDDEQISLGLGERSRSWPRDAPPATIPDGLGRIPVALVTGTNGKTTSVRLVARMLARAGRIAGAATTDAISVGDTVIARGDYTGPEAARRVLRHPQVEVAVLETARGGILRRGLAVDDVDAALITNVGDDHLGLYGIDDVQAMARVKAVVARAVRADGTIVVNDDDALLKGFRWTARVVGFSTRGPAEWHLAEGAVARRGERLVALADVPITFDGAAAYNVANVLGAAALASALGVSDEHNDSALRDFDDRDNPGRGNVHDVGGVKLVLDFAHNPASVAGLMALLAALRHHEGRIFAVLGPPGDRRDDAIRAVAGAVAAAGPARVFVHDLEGYLRGRAPGEVPALLRAALAARGVAVEEAASEADGVERALAGARPGDVVAVFPMLDADGVRRAIGQ